MYLSEDTRLHRKVALKRLSGSQLSTPEARRQILREAQAAAILNHPNIAVVYDVIDDGEQSIIVMEYVAGETLARRVLRGRLSPEQVIDISIQLTSALAEAHAHEIIHRDLKPANILLTPDGKAKILDFGLAKAPAAQDVSATTDGRVVGTPAYMAPEQMLGYRADHRSDLFSLAVVLFQLLTGRWPFEDRDSKDWTLEAMKKHTPRGHGFRREYPGGAERGGVPGNVSRTSATSTVGEGARRGAEVFGDPSCVLTLPDVLEGGGPGDHGYRRYGRQLGDEGVRNPHPNVLDRRTAANVSQRKHRNHRRSIFTTTGHAYLTRDYQPHRRRHG